MAISRTRGEHVLNGRRERNHPGSGPTFRACRPGHDPQHRTDKCLEIEAVMSDPPCLASGDTQLGSLGRKPTRRVDGPMYQRPRHAFRVYDPPVRGEVEVVPGDLLLATRTDGLGNRTLVVWRAGQTLHIPAAKPVR
jgi:hypothetical protein